MTLEEELRLSYYKEIAVLDGAHGVLLARHVENGKVFVKKTLSVYEREVFERLKERPITGVPKIYELAEEGGRLIVIEEFVNGTTLQSVLAREERIPAERAVDITVRLARILRDLHGARPAIVHRDIKPSNVMILDDGGVILLDMNAAKQPRGDGKRDTELIGTAGYAAPEQYGFSESDARTDIYSLGVLLNVMACGALPQERTAPGKIGKIVEKCTKMDPKGRYASASELLSDLSGEEKLAGAKRAWRRYAPPGFRTGHVRNMLIAATVYALIAVVSFSMTSGQLPENLWWISRIGFFITFMVMAFFSADYCEVQESIGISRIKNRRLRRLAIIGVNFAIFCVGVFVVVIAEDMAGAS